MTPTPPASNTPSSNGHDQSTGPNNEQYRVIRKRNRVPLSCAPCRNRKLKCNRSMPCENCVKRGDAASCSYASPGGRRKATSRSSSSTTPDDMQNRIDRLEGLVLSLMTNGNEAAGPSAANRTLSMSASTSSQDFSPSLPHEDHFREEEEEGDSETERVAKSFGVLHFQNNKAMYLGDSHWAAILHDISEVKNYFGEHKKQYEDAIKKVEASKKQAGTDYTGPAFLIGGRNPPRRSELIASLPGRDAVDKMVGRYFNDYDPSTHILHPPSWRRTYEKHWQDPEKTDPTFLGQLFAICGLAMQSYHKNEDEPYEYRGRTLSLASNYSALTQQCLLLADFTKPEHTMMETLILYLHGEYNKAGEADVGLWILVAIVVRLAMRMGLHRDGRHYLNISPFHAEMRRRIWTFVRQTDLLFSFQVGLPSMIRAGDCDTELPSNLMDEDFDEQSQQLPPSRPITTYTSVSYLIGKSVIAFIFGKIVEVTQNLKALPYEDVVKFDLELRDAYNSLPPLLHMKSMEDSQMDPMSTHSMRFNIALLYNKGLCVLHRRYLDCARENSRYAHSRQACVDASMTLLRYQATLHVESQPGKRMHRVQWYSSSLMMHDFILAATLVALDLFYSAKAEGEGRPIGDVEMWGHDRRDEMTQALETTRSIWGELRDSYIEAFKAFSIIGVMLLKIQNIRAQTTARMAGAYAYNVATNGNKPQQQYSPPEEEKPEHSAAITLGMLSSGMANSQTGAYSTGPYPLTPPTNNATMTDVPSTGLTPNYAMDQSSNAQANNAPNPFPFFNGANTDIPPNLDWSAWDSYIQNSQMNPESDTWLQNMDLLIASGGMGGMGSMGGGGGGGGSGSEGQEGTGGGSNSPQQLNSNLFANNPALLPPGTTL